MVQIQTFITFILMLALIFFFVLEVDIDIQKTKGYKGARAFEKNRRVVQ